MIRAILGVLALCLSLMVNQAQAAVAAPSSAFDDFMRVVTGPGKQTISFGSNGTPVISPGVPSLSSAGGSLGVARTGSLPLAGGARLPVTASAKISSSAAAVIIKKALPLIPYIGTAVAVYQVAKDLGFGLDNSSGTVVVTTQDPYACYTAPCTLYRNGSAQGSTVWGYGVALAAYYTSIDSKYSYSVFNVVGTTIIMELKYKSNGAHFNYTNYSAAGYAVGPVPPDSPLPSTLQALEDAIAAQSGWPSSSAIAQAVVDAQKITGDKIPTDLPDVTGPPSVDGPEEVTKSGNKTTTKKTSFDCTYDNSAKFGQYGGSVSCQEKTKSTDVITDPVTGDTETIPGDETTSPVDPSQEDVPAIDTALPAQPTLYKRQYPDGLTGVWNSKKAELLATPLLQLTSNLQPTIAAPGGYPTWPVPVVIGHWNFGTYDVSPASYVWDFLKVCTIIGALFLARALIFGG